MDCEQSEPLIYPFLIVSLDASLSAGMEQHLDACEDCLAMLRAYGDRVSDFAKSVPQIQAPDRIRHALLARIDDDSHRRNAALRQQVWRFAAIVAASLSRKRTASLLMGIVLMSGCLLIYQTFENGSSAIDTQALVLLEEQSRKQARASSGSERMLEREEAATVVAQLANTTPYSSSDGLHMAQPPGMSLSTLRGTANAIEARGVLIVSGRQATLLTLNLPPLPSDKVYQIWLVRAERITDAGLFSVDATGYGQTVIMPYLSLAEYNGIAITIEPASGSTDPTGESILQGDL